MASIRIASPGALERTAHPLVYGAGLAEVAQRLDLVAYPGRALRAKGQSRAQDVSTSSTTVTGAAVVTAPDCRKMLLDGSLGGVLRAHPAAFGRAIGTNCHGPTPECTEVFRDPDVPCDPGQQCAAPFDHTGGPYDIDYEITSVLGSKAVSFDIFPTVDKLVRACVGAYDGQIYTPATVRMRVVNNSGQCVFGQLRANIKGLSCGQLMKWRGNGDTGFPASSEDGVAVSQGFFCLPAGGTFDEEFQYAIVGQASDCGALARVNGWRLAYRCAEDSPDGLCVGTAPGNTLAGCSSCP